jgi:predicted phosphodiesterase
MGGRTWTNEEIDFLVMGVRDRHLTPYQALIELNAKFPDKLRTLKGVNGKIWMHGLSTKHTYSERVPVFEGVKPTANGPISEAFMREELSKLGYKVEKLSPDKMDRKVVIDPAMFEGESYRFGVVSCTHLGSKFQQLTYLSNFYRHCQDKGIKVMLHCGDLVDGIKVYKGQEFELFLHGLDAQVNYAIEKYPKMENGGKTYVIDGNHDYSFVAEVGGDPLPKIASARPDIEYLGAYGAYPIIGPLKTYIQHGARGMAYARSYRLQKNIEGFAPESKPDLYFLGHYHVGCYLPEYRNVFSAMVPCFQSQTPFLRRLGLYPEVAGLIVEVTVNDRFRKSGMVGMDLKWIPFYVPLENDY